jgi:hypothetical protein
MRLRRRKQRPQPAAWCRKEADLQDRALALTRLELDTFEPARAQQVVREALCR